MDVHEAGRKGGAARKARLTPERRSEIARAAAVRRWLKKEARERDKLARPNPAMLGPVPAGRRLASEVNARRGHHPRCQCAMCQPPR